MSRIPISVVIPVYNEEGNIHPFYKEVRQHIPDRYDAEYLFVDDGSTDATLEKIKELQSADASVKHLSFTRNFGHQCALKAGLDHARGKAVISLDGDFQHPPRLIPALLEKWEKEGCKIVHTIRRDADPLPLGKRLTSRLFYSCLNALTDVRIEPGCADFRLLDREVVDWLARNAERALFLRGLVAWTGFPSGQVEYRPAPRLWGQSKYTLSKMTRLALDATTSFSVLPLRLATILGLFMAIFSGSYAVYTVAMWLLNRPRVVTGWPSVILSILFIGGLQLLMLGIMGEYIGKIFLEAKNRPLYVVKDAKV